MYWLMQHCQSNTCCFTLLGRSLKEVKHFSLIKKKKTCLTLEYFWLWNLTWELKKCHASLLLKKMCQHVACLFSPTLHLHTFCRAQVWIYSHKTHWSKCMSHMNKIKQGRLVWFRKHFQRIFLNLDYIWNMMHIYHLHQFCGSNPIFFLHLYQNFTMYNVFTQCYEEFRNWFDKLVILKIWPFFFC